MAKSNAVATVTKIALEQSYTAHVDTHTYLQSPDGCSESQSQNGWQMVRCHMYVCMYVGKWSVMTYYSRNWHTQIVPGSNMDHESDTEVLFEARHLYSDPPASNSVGVHGSLMLP